MTTLPEILLAHHTRYPQWQIADLYKLLHQGAMGSEHAVPNAEHARRWLEDDLAHLAPASPGEPLIDPISPGGAIVRVHLRPFNLMNLDTALLLDAFLRTASGFRGSTPDLERAWLTARALCTAALLPFDPKEMDNFIAPMREKGFPPVHHSDAYQTLYNPAYRVVARAYLPANVSPVGWVEGDA